jgi:hypothetical protein
MVCSKGTVEWMCSINSAKTQIRLVGNTTFKTVSVCERSAAQALSSQASWRSQSDQSVPELITIYGDAGQEYVASRPS